jgi:tetratricopeptide (TPR) repeat protein
MTRSANYTSRDPPRDSVTAVRALELAHAYLSEVADDLGKVAGDPARTAAALNTLSLASKELDKVARADRTASLTVDDKDCGVRIFTLNDLKAFALLYEGLCRSLEDPRRAIRILEQATAIAPDAAEAHYWIGVLNIDLSHRKRAVAALERAVTLDPDNLEYRKALGRAESISGAQGAFERAATGVSRTARAIKWAVIGIICAMLISLVANLADPATRGPTILGIIGVAIAIGFLVESVKIVWGDITGRKRRP